MVRNVLAVATAALLAAAAGATGPAAAQPLVTPNRRIPPDARRPRPATATTTASMPSSMSATMPASIPADMEKGPWTDATAATRVKYELAGDVTQTREFVRADANTVTIRSTTSIAGAKPVDTDYPRVYTTEGLQRMMSGFGRKTGTGTLTVGETECSCDVYVKEMTFGRTKVVTKTWICREVPGWTVRVDNDASGEMMTISRVIQYTGPKSGE